MRKIPFKQSAWKYPEAIVFCSILLILSFSVELLLPETNVVVPRWPKNFIILILFASLVLIVSYSLKSRFLTWFSSLQFAITVIACFSILVLFMGIIPQVPTTGFIEKSGLSHIKRSWPFFLLTLLLLSNLGLTILKKRKDSVLRKTMFWLLHGGLWLIFATSTLGSEDTERLKVSLKEGNSTDEGISPEGKIHKLEFAIKLIDFQLVEYTPLLGIADLNKGEFVIEKGGKLMDAMDSVAMIDNYLIRILNYLPNAIPEDVGFIPDSSAGSGPVVFAEVQKLNGEKIRGWISSGTYFFNPRVLEIDNGKALAMAKGSPNRYQSILEFSENSKRTIESVEVNKPVSFGGWEIYQMSYNEQLGKWSDLSTLELIKDPWIPLVYTGIFMLIAGSLLLAWFGAKTYKSIPKTGQYDE